jgi:transcriptional regulator with XRE-family HTH domain
METFGKRLAFLISRSTFRSDAEFARAIGYSNVQLSKIIHSKASPRTEVVSLMVKILREKGVEVDYDWLIDGNQSPFYQKYIDAIEQFNVFKLNLAKSSSNRSESSAPLKNLAYAS